MSSYTCQCCLAPGCTKNIFTEYFCNGLKEVYSEMLQNTLNIIVQDNPPNNNICETCIVDLRMATTFKTKVLNAQSQLARIRGQELEENYDDFEDKISVDFYDDSTAGYDNNTDKGQIFYVEVTQKNNSDDDVSSNFPGVEDVEEIVEIKEKKNSKQLTMELRSPKTIEVSDDNPMELTPKLRHPQAQNYKDLKRNSLELVFNSNLCLFKSLKTKFGCFLCEEAFFTIKDLRQHYKTHLNTELIRTKFNRLRGLSYQNADISSLECTKCAQPCLNLTELKKHLSNAHGVQFGDAEHFLIPYKLEDSFNCVVCDEKFNTYMRLSVHMNKHYANNVCEICGSSYINRMSLRIHVHSRHRVKKCSLCPDTFLNNYARIRHMRNCHNSCFSKRYCLICGQTFRYTYQLVQHKVEEHGLKKLLSKCTLCPKTFPNAQNLKIHIRSVHVRERNFPCNECGMRFFTKFDQKRHEQTHDNTRSFTCGYCESKFKGKDSLRRHFKKQHGDLMVSGQADSLVSDPNYEARGSGLDSR